MDIPDEEIALKTVQEMLSEFILHKVIDPNGTFYGGSPYVE